jgi:hypothetical protein
MLSLGVELREASLKRAVAPSLLTAALLLMALAAPASAMQLGVTYKTPDQDRIVEVARRADIVSTPFNWRMAQRTQTQFTTGKYDWEQQDRIVRDAGEAGTPLLARLHGMPSYAACNFAGYPGQLYMSGYLDFIQRVVNRYEPGGNFWQLKKNRSVPNNPITEWQVHNEPDLGANWCGTTDAVGFATYFVQVAQRIHGANAKATVVMGGMGGAARRNDWAYVRTVLQQPNVQDQADRLAVHPYAGRPLDVIRVIQGFRAALDSEEYMKPIFVTEWGWVTGGDPDHKLYTSEAGQKNKLEISITEMRAQAEALRLEKALIFTAYDQRDADNDIFDFAGLYRADGTPKPAADVLPR